MVRVMMLAAAVAALAGCSGGGPSASAATQDSGVIPVAERQAAPALEAETLEGDVLSLADLPGAVVVNFWASWCGPCVEEEPDLVTAANRYADRGVSFVGVNVKDTRANAQAFVRQFDVPYPSWYDESAAIAGQFGGIGPSALPTTLVLDAEHRVAARLFGAVDLSTLSVTIDAVIEAT